MDDDKDSWITIRTSLGTYSKRTVDTEGKTMDTVMEHAHFNENSVDVINDSSDENSMKVMKRDGRIVDFDPENITEAIIKAFKDVKKGEEIDAQDLTAIHNITTTVESRIKSMYPDRAVAINEIQNLVEHSLLDNHYYDVANSYKDYRWKKDIARAKQTDANEAVKRFVRKDKDIINENANKDGRVFSTQRDLLAGAISKSAALQLLPRDVSNAHAKCDIHFHDADYSPFTTMTNCSLPNFKEMLANGFALGNAVMGSPNSIETAATQVTQIMLDVASSQYGGQTINRTDEILAPYAEKNYSKNLETAAAMFPDGEDIDAARRTVARMKARERKWLHIEDREPIPDDVAFHEDADELEQLREIYAKILTRKNIYDAMQTMEYQVNTQHATCGQTPFVTVGFGLGTSWFSREITRCIFYIRIAGLGKDHRTAIFPKLTYTIKHGINSESTDPNYDLKQLALECTSKRMYPDILFYENIEKITGSFKAPMGAVSGDEVVTWSDGEHVYTEGFERMWKRLSARYQVRSQGTGGDDWYIDTPDNIVIKDSHDGTAKFVKVSRIISNQPREWRRVTFKGGRVIDCTDDHPFEVHGRGRIHADDLTVGDVISKANDVRDSGTTHYTTNVSWLLGFIMCDGCLNENSETLVSFANQGEDEIADRIDSMYPEHSLRHKSHDRGRKGIYKEIAIKDTWLRNLCIAEFGGMRKSERAVPSDIMESTSDERLAFLAGIIDADGYINSKNEVQIGSTRRQLAVGELLLAESLGYHAALYQNHYVGRNYDLIRYQVSFRADDNIVNKVVCAKKREHFNADIHRNAYAYDGIAIVDKVDALTSDARSYDVTTEADYFDVSGLVSHNCRSFLQGWVSPETGEDEEEGRMNLGVVTVNIPRIAIESRGSIKRFWKIFNQRMTVAHHALQFRIKRCTETVPANAPVLWKNGAFGKLGDNGNVDSLMKNSRSTVSLGYIGLDEATAMFYGKEWINDFGWDDDARDFAISILRNMTELCKEWENEEGYHY